MSTLMNELASTPPTNHLQQQPMITLRERYASNAATPCLPLPLIMLRLLLHPHDMPLMLPPNVGPHPSLQFCTPPNYLLHLPCLLSCIRSIAYIGLLA
ncbi:hypothetical protein O181_099937 [Austropuccinia psidii MF-1]|uniref:Uncharacterized protein n=1 Tax=Austropuccinia psidii MF-1 TaxID=1389203 RepID=A0A9Q3JE93_9BASI|nr:hypothetical protein [Austropuccinia psidii MF-1]